MSDLLPGLIVLAVGGSVAPPLLLLTILSLSSRRPIPNSVALSLGYITTCATVGILGLTLASETAEAGALISTVGRFVSVALGGVLIILGIRSLLNVPDPAAPPPGWIKSIGVMSPARAFGLGAALFPVQVKNLAIFVACIGLIASAGLGARASAAALGMVLLIFALPVFALICLYAVLPQRGSMALGSLRAWMDKNNRAITVVLCLVFGTFFLARGIY